MSEGAKGRLRPVLLLCERAGLPVNTGVMTRDLADLPRQNLLVDCPHCGSDHAWRPIDVFLGSSSTVAGVAPYE